MITGSSQLVEQHLRLFRVGYVQPIDEPAVYCGCTKLGRHDVLPSLQTFRLMLRQRAMADMEACLAMDRDLDERAYMLPTPPDGLLVGGSGCNGSSMAKIGCNRRCCGTA